MGVGQEKRAIYPNPYPYPCPCIALGDAYFFVVPKSCDL